MIENAREMETISAEELRVVRGGKSFWGRVKDGVKRAAKWVKDHVVIGLRSIGFKGRF